LPHGDAVFLERNNNVISDVWFLKSSCKYFIFNGDAG